MPVPYDIDTIKKFSLLLRSEYKENNRSTPSLNAAIGQFQENEKQVDALLSNFSSLNELTKVLLLSDHLDCNSCESIKIVQKVFIHVINYVFILFCKTINEYRFSLSHIYNTGQEIQINM